MDVPELQNANASVYLCPFVLVFFFLPDIVLVSEHDDGASVGRLQQTQDDLIELAGARLPKDLQRLSDADAA